MQLTVSSLNLLAAVEEVLRVSASSKVLISHCENTLSIRSLATSEKYVSLI